LKKKLEGKISWVTKKPFAWLLCQVDFSYVTKKKKKKKYDLTPILYTK
jgi:hypothetical protein